MSRSKNIIILYNDGGYRFIKASKIKKYYLEDRSIKTIFIPLDDNPYAYIPIKPNLITYKFKKAKVYIKYQAFMYDYSEESGYNFDPQEFFTETDNLVDFINALYNCFKFRAISIIIGETRVNTDYDLGSWVIYPRKILVELFDKFESIYSTIDSGDMEDLSLVKPKQFQKLPPEYSCEDRLESLNNIFYTPLDTRSSDYGESALKTLPTMIKLDDENEWEVVKKPGKELKRDDVILYKIDDFAIYYCTKYGVYENLLKVKPFTVIPLSYPNEIKCTDEIFVGLDKNIVPSASEKIHVIERYINGELDIPFNVQIEIRSPQMFLLSLIFVKIIFYYIMYLTRLMYNGDNYFIMKDFIIFTRDNMHNINNSKLICGVEVNDDNLFKAFMSMTR